MVYPIHVDRSKSRTKKMAVTKPKPTSFLSLATELRHQILRNAVLPDLEAVIASRGVFGALRCHARSPRTTKDQTRWARRSLAEVCDMISTLYVALAGQAAALEDVRWIGGEAHRILELLTGVGAFSNYQVFSNLSEWIIEREDEEVYIKNFLE